MNPYRFGRSDPGTAAEWFALRRASPDAGVERRFSAWLAASEENLEAYAVCELTWELTASAAAGLEVRPRELKPWYRRTLTRAIAAVLALLTLAVSVMQLEPPRVKGWSTGPGEQLTVALEDGTRMTLNTRSLAEVRMGRRSRQVRILRGEVFFDIAHDSARPFEVATPLGTVRAVGTRFDVLLEDDRVEVNMEEGKVLVTASGDYGPPLMATAGARATIVAGVPRPTLGSADLNRLENWRAHRVEFDRVPLSAALKEFSRYTSLPIRVESERKGQLEISAVIQTGDLSALESMLQGAFGLKIVRQKDELVVR